jgi:proprotein convertase subtilisin/kexin type 5
MECTSCFTSLFLYNFTCFDVCPTKTFNLQNTYNCSDCHSTCSECFGPSQNQCLSCIPGLYFYLSQCYK